MTQMTLAGIWIGNTRDDLVLHHWRIEQRGDEIGIFITLDLSAALNMKSGPIYFHTARLVKGAMRIHSQPPVDAVFVDAEHFVLPNWDESGDMMFSREGLAELTAPAAWERYDRVRQST